MVYRLNSAIDSENVVSRSKSPRGYPANATWDNVDGATLDGKTIIVAQQSQLIGANLTINTSQKRAAGLINHEYGHAADLIHGISASNEFLDAYFEDITSIQGNISTWTKQQLAELNYALQPGVAGAQEAFAEIFAQLHGAGTAQYLNILSAFPKTTKIVEMWIKTL